MMSEQTSTAAITQESVPGTKPEISIRVDASAVTFGDLEMAMGFDNGTVDLKELLPFLNRVVVGGVRHLPLSAMPAILEALTEAFSSLGNPKN